MNECGYYIGDGPKKPSGSTPRTTAADFRKLTPIVLMGALEQAGTVVCEPIAKVSLEIPMATMGAVLPVLARLGATVETPSLQDELLVIETSSTTWTSTPFGGTAAKRTGLSSGRSWSGRLRFG